MDITISEITLLDCRYLGDLKLYKGKNHFLLYLIASVEKDDIRQLAR